MRWVTLLLILFFPSAVHAVPVQTKSFNGDTWIISVGSGLSGLNIRECDAPSCDEIVPVEPSRNRIAWRWNGGSPDTAITEAIIVPDPNTALDRFVELAVQLTGDKRTAYQQLTEQPELLITLLSGRYDDTRLALDLMVQNGSITQENADKFKEILTGERVP